MACGPKVDKNVCPHCGGSKPSCGGSEGGKANCGCGGDKKKMGGKKRK